MVEEEDEGKTPRLAFLTTFPISPVDVEVDKDADNPREFGKTLDAVSVGGPVEDDPSVEVEENVGGAEGLNRAEAVLLTVFGGGTVGAEGGEGGRGGKEERAGADLTNEEVARLYSGGSGFAGLA